MKRWKKLLIIPPVIAGIVFFVFMKQSSRKPAQTIAKERTYAVRFIPAPRVDVIPRSIGYGYAQPGQTWDGIAEVGGKIVEMHKDLKKGIFVTKGTVLLRVDPSSYGLAETRGQANVMSINAQLNELEQNKKNTERLLAVEKKSLKLASQELERKRELFESGYISESDLEREETAFLSQQTSVNNLQNRLDLIPAQRKALLAQKQSGVSTLVDQQLTLKKTEIIAPFDCRISSVNVELDQFAGTGAVLIEADSIDTAEIPVQLSPVMFASLLPRIENPIRLIDFDMDTIRRAIGISAIVRISLFGQQIEWPARFSRTSESMDLNTGALTVYVAVDGPYDKVIPGKRPPLMKNTYCEVELRGRAIMDRVVVPRSALHEGRVFVVNKENRLEKRIIEIETIQGDIIVVKSGLDKDESVVVSDLTPAIDGMLLDPVKDESSLTELIESASGENAVK